jgi:hypothetical protein
MPMSLVSQAVSASASGHRRGNRYRNNAIGNASSIGPLGVLELTMPSLKRSASVRSAVLFASPVMALNGYLAAILADLYAENSGKKSPQYKGLADLWRILWRMLERRDHSL